MLATRTESIQPQPRPIHIESSKPKVEANDETRAATPFALEIPGQGRWAGLVLGIILTMAIFLGVALAGITSRPQTHKVEVAMVPPVAEPVPNPPQEILSKASEMQLPDVPVLEKTPVEVEIRPANVALSILTSPRLSDFDVQLPDSVNAMGEIEQILDLSQTGASAYLVNRPSFRFPRELERRGIHEGSIEVLIQIDENDRARLEAIIHADHPALHETARRIIENGIFRVDGEPRRPLRVRWTLNLEAP